MNNVYFKTTQIIFIFNLKNIVNMNIGYSSRLPYDNDDTYSDKLQESTSPVNYRINSDQIYNGQRCRSKFGPRSGYMGHGVSVPRDLGYAEAQDLIEVDSVFSNRNVRASKAKKGRVNPINPVESYTLYDSKVCDNTLDPLYTKDTHPASNYRGLEINRFYNLPRNPQNVIFQDFAVNTRLEAIDNFQPDVPQPWPDLAGPKPDPNVKFGTCTYDCNSNSMSCPKGFKQ